LVYLIPHELFLFLIYRQNDHKEGERDDETWRFY
jgi:hypothetical protein